MEMNLTPDQALRVMFYEKGVHQPYQSTEEKRPIFKTVTYVKIVSGGGLSEIDRPMYVGEDEVKYAKAWEAFKAGKSASMIGTPLTMWAGSGLDVGAIKQLEAIGYFTVENVASMPDFDLLKFSGSRDLRKRALMFLEGAAGRAPTEKLMNEIQARDDEIRDMKSQINELLAMQKAQSQDKQEKPNRKTAA